MRGGPVVPMEFHGNDIEPTAARPFDASPRLDKADFFVRPARSWIVIKDLEPDRAKVEGFKRLGHDQPGSFRAKSMAPCLFFADNDTKKARAVHTIDLCDRRCADQIP